jgi:hypothetical protein
MSSRFGPRSPDTKLTPVTLPPGRLRLPKPFVTVSSAAELLLYLESAASVLKGSFRTTPRKSVENLWTKIAPQLTVALNGPARAAAQPIRRTMTILNCMEDCQWRSVGAPSAPRSVGAPPAFASRRRRCKIHSV